MIEEEKVEREARLLMAATAAVSIWEKFGLSKTHDHLDICVLIVGSVLRTMRPDNQKKTRKMFSEASQHAADQIAKVEAMVDAMGRKPN